VAAGRERGSRPRRVSLPGVAELLRPVGPGLANDSGRQASGREAHPQKITVYLASDEFLDLERARLTLRAHGIGADRGRLVREAIALLMTDLEAGIDASVIARRLRTADQPDPVDGALAAVRPASTGPVANDAPTNDAPTNDAPTNDGLANGAPANGGPANAVPVDGGFVNGVLADDGAVYGGPVVGVLADSGAVNGVLASGTDVTGSTEGPQ
jgi:hypothetical protein